MSIPIRLNANPASSSAHHADRNAKLPPGLARISHDEVVLIELQGTLDVETPSGDARERDGGLVGRLSVDESNTKATLRIGHHLLEGKIASMPKPLAVLARSKPVQTAQSEGNPDRNADATAIDRHDVDMDIDVDREGGDERESGSRTPDKTQPPSGWDIVALVKRKIIFSKRPMPIVSKAGS